jgi:hypothetical protein
VKTVAVLAPTQEQFREACAGMERRTRSEAVQGDTKFIHVKSAAGARGLMLAAIVLLAGYDQELVLPMTMNLRAL